MKSVAATGLAAVTFAIAAGAQERNLYWGDTHLHTTNSPDAFFLGNSTGAGPEVAYRYAKGLPVVNAYSGVRIQIQTALDFLVVADHAEYLGVPRLIFNEKDESLLATEFGKRLSDLWEAGDTYQAALEVIGTINDQNPYAPFETKEIRSTAWARQIEAAEAANEPGVFSAIIGWEWTSFPNASNLHRVIFTPDDGGKARQYIPFSAFDSSDPRNLWDWLDETSEAVDTRFIAIPHNANVSNGLMWSRENLDGSPLTAAQAAQRIKWEPVVEMTQIKGDAETHPTQSPDDEFADFGTYDHLLDAAGAAAGGEVASVAKEGDYARRALRVGMEIEQSLGTNTFKFGMVGSTDAHSTMASAEEQNFWGKFSIDSTPSNRRDMGILPGASNMFGVNAAGLAAVWAEENSRESIYEAFMRKEVYATSGPRISLRVFGGYNFKPGDALSADIAEVGYSNGVPMGGNLPVASNGAAPRLLISALKDSNSGNLDRIQVVKGWADHKGKTYEKIFDVAWSGDRKIGADGKLPPVGNTVNLETGKYTNTIGEVALSTVWTDPEFDPNLSAFYYVRVLEIPTPRYSLLDAIALNMDPSETGQPATIQERAYSSPIWYTPARTSETVGVLAPDSATLTIEALLADGFVRMSADEIDRTIMGNQLQIHDLITGLVYAAVASDGSRSLELTDQQKDRAIGSLFHGGPLLIGDATFEIEGDRVISSDGVTTVAASLLRKGEKIYAARDIDRGRVNFEIILGG